MRRAIVTAFVAAVAGLLLHGACERGSKEESPAASDAGAQDDVPPPITVTRERKDLVFTYVLEGAFKTASSIDEIPEKSRGTVVVTDLSLTPEQRRSARYVYLADLRTPRADGSYPVSVASRYGFEAKLTGTSTAGASGAGEVVMYSASWCGVCKRAKQILRDLGVRYVEKDIEASRSAAEELATKARAAGFQPGGVPVIDVGGTILQGLDEPTLRAVLKEKGFLR